MIGTLELKSRPLRLGFLVDPAKSRAIREAIELNSIIWAGAYNPIIPVYRRTSSIWKDPFKAPKAKDIARGYIEAFDPDILVECSSNLPDYIKTLGLPLIKAHDIWKIHATSYQGDKFNPKYGISIFDIFNLIYQEHFRYQEKHPPKVIIPKLPRVNNLFWISVFGNLPKNVAQKISNDYKEALEIEEPKIVPSELQTNLKGNILFPRRLTQYDLSFRKRSGFRNEDCVFFMDATKNLDIIDYWNLRALGRQVIPAPKQFLKEKSLREIIINFVKSSRKPLRNNPQIYNHATFIRSRNTTMDDMQAFAKSLEIKKDSNDKSDESMLSLQHWYPRVWDDWARSKDGAEADEIYHEEKEVDLTDDKDSVRIRFILPSFVSRYGGFEEPRFANEINFRLYGADKMYAQVFPKSDGENFIRTISGIYSLGNEWRVGRNGLIRQIQHKNVENWNFPLAQEVFSAWMKDLGWEVKISTPGLLARQIYSQLGGSLRTLANEKLLKLFEKMNSGSSEGTGLSVGEIKNQLSKSLYDYLISLGVFKTTIKIQCPNCQRHSLYSLESISENLSCPKCLNDFKAIGNIDSGGWHYKTAGPFSLPNYADGAYTVLITISFFEHNMHSLRITPALSFEAVDSQNKVLEADYGVLWRDSIFGETMEGIIFGECKTFGDFQQKDFDKMRNLGEKFPGAILAFCTLKKDLKKSEIVGITKIAKAGRKMWKNERPKNPVLVLTGNELLGLHGPPYCWNDKHGNKYDRAYSLLDVADVTQQIYLNLPSWQSILHKKIDEKIKRSQEKLSKVQPVTSQASSK